MPKSMAENQGDLIECMDSDQQILFGDHLKPTCCFKTSTAKEDIVKKIGKNRKIEVLSDAEEENKEFDKTQKIPRRVNNLVKESITKKQVVFNRVLNEDYSLSD